MRYGELVRTMTRLREPPQSSVTSISALLSALWRLSTPMPAAAVEASTVCGSSRARLALRLCSLLFWCTSRSRSEGKCRSHGMQ